MTPIPLKQREANAFIAAHHRHHKPPQGWLFGIGAEHEGQLLGIAVVGRPVSRMRDDGRTAEVTRLCCLPTLPVVKGHPLNVASFLYAASWRACRAMGYRRIGTYLLNTESGRSVSAAGWKLVGEAGGGSWHREARAREDNHPTQRKTLWAAAAADGHGQEGRAA